MNIWHKIIYAIGMIAMLMIIFLVITWVFIF